MTSERALDTYLPEHVASPTACNSISVQAFSTWQESQWVGPNTEAFHPKQYAMPVSAARLSSVLTEEETLLGFSRVASKAAIERPDNQAWFWTEEWQRAERETDEDIREGKVATFGDVEDLIDDLDK